MSISRSFMPFVGCVGSCTGGWRFEHVTLIVYDKNSRHQLFLTCVFRECQLLCNARANGCCEPSNRRFTSDLPVGYQLFEFSWFRFWDAIVPTLGRVSAQDFIRNLSQGAKRKSQPVCDDRDDDANPGHLQT